MRKHWNHIKAALLGASLLGGATTAVGQTSELYLTDFDSGATFVVQGGQIIRQWNRTSNVDGSGLVVTSTVKCVGRVPGAVGHEYDYNGNMLTGTYPNGGYQDLYDGATDGTHNWSIAHNDFNTNFAVIEADADWANQQVLWVPQRRSSGIAYDATDNTLWITNNSGGTDRTQHYDLAGNLLGEFTSNHSGGGYGLALDPADNTLWIAGAFGTAHQLFQYDRSGNLLQTVTIGGLASNIVGAEFEAGGSPSYSLRVGGVCPGQVSVSWTNATPNRSQGLVFGNSQGMTTIPQNQPCHGTVLGLSGNVRLLDPPGIFSTGNGSGMITGRAGTAACGHYLQLVEGGTCQVTNVARIP